LEFEVVVAESMLVLAVVVVLLFPGKLMMVDDVDDVDVPLLEVIPVVVAVLRQSMIGQI